MGGVEDSTGPILLCGHQCPSAPMDVPVLAQQTVTGPGTSTSSACSQSFQMAVGEPRVRLRVFGVGGPEGLITLEDSQLGLFCGDWRSNMVPQAMPLLGQYIHCFPLFEGAPRHRYRVLHASAEPRSLMLPKSVAVLPCHLGWRTLLKCNKTNHACLLHASSSKQFAAGTYHPGI